MKSIHCLYYKTAANFPQRTWPWNGRYKDHINGTKGSPYYKVIIPMPEQGDKLLHAAIMLQRGGFMVRVHIITQKRDHEGNPIGCANQISILDLCQYVLLEFDNGYASELIANIISLDP